MYQIQQIPVPNYGTRGNHKPIAIVNHITVGSKQSVINTFKNPANAVSSNFLVCRDGSIIQFVDIRNRAHANGYVRSPKSPLVQQMGNVNANYYTVSIEHEGYEVRDNQTGELLEYHGVKGELTEEQYQATLWLHKYIQTEVERIYKVRIPLNSHQVIAHHQVDSQKGTCPGVNFPWNRLYADLARIDNMTLEEYEEEVLYKRTARGLSADAYAFLNRMYDLEEKAQGSKYEAEAKRKILLMSPVMGQLGLAADPTVENILQRIKEIEKAAITDGKWQQEGLRKLSIAVAHAKNAGLIP